MCTGAPTVLSGGCPDSRKTLLQQYRLFQCTANKHNHEGSLTKFPSGSSGATDPRPTTTFREPNSTTKRGSLARYSNSTGASPASPLIEKLRAQNSARLEHQRLETLARSARTATIRDPGPGLGPKIK